MDEKLEPAPQAGSTRGRGHKQETWGQQEQLDAGGAERDGPGFVGKVHSSLDGAVEREEGVSPAF